MDKRQQQRRALLVQLLTSGFFMTAATSVPSLAWSMSRMPGLPPGRSIYQLSGQVTIDGQPATLDTPITTRSHIVTGNDGKLIFVVGKDAFILRDNSRLEIEGNIIIDSLRLVTGKLLSVFGKRRADERLRVQTAVATIGIRGTGLYVESEPDRSYVCTCYGVSEITSLDDPQSTERVESRHHDVPRYVYANAAKGKKIQMIRQAPVINHTDDELELIENLVGRTTPFVEDDSYY